MIEALKMVAQGSGATDAAAYDPGKSGVHPIVMFAKSNELIDEWNSSLPASWRPLNISQAELVAVIMYRNVDLNTTRYHVRGESGWIYVTRIRMDVAVILYEARTGATIASTVFTGGEPPSFPPTLSSSTTALYGTSVPHETMMDWLKPFVEK